VETKKGSTDLNTGEPKSFYYNYYYFYFCYLLLLLLLLFLLHFMGSPNFISFSINKAKVKFEK
jgi:hypothetical protein